jgi:hypothetical protein
VRGAYGRGKWRHRGPLSSSLLAIDLVQYLPVWLLPRETLLTSISRHERQEGKGLCKDIPWGEAPSAEEGAENGPPADVELRRTIVRP